MTEGYPPIFPDMPVEWHRKLWHLLTIELNLFSHFSCVYTGMNNAFGILDKNFNSILTTIKWLPFSPTVGSHGQTSGVANLKSKSVAN